LASAPVPFDDATANYLKPKSTEPGHFSLMRRPGSLWSRPPLWRNGKFWLEVALLLKIMA